MYWKALLLQHKLPSDLFWQCCIRTSLNQWEKKVYVFGPPAKNEVNFKIQLYENQKDKKAILLLVSIMRYSYNS